MGCENAEHAHHRDEMRLEHGPRGCFTRSSSFWQIVAVRRLEDRCSFLETTLCSSAWVLLLSLQAVVAPVTMLCDYDTPAVCLQPVQHPCKFRSCYYFHFP